MAQIYSQKTEWQSEDYSLLVSGKYFFILEIKETLFKVIWWKYLCYVIDEKYRKDKTCWLESKGQSSIWWITGQKLIY